MHASRRWCVGSVGCVTVMSRFGDWTPLQHPQEESAVQFLDTLIHITYGPTEHTCVYQAATKADLPNSSRVCQVVPEKRHGVPRSFSWLTLCRDDVLPCMRGQCWTGPGMHASSVLPFDTFVRTSARRVNGREELVGPFRRDVSTQADCTRRSCLMFVADRDAGRARRRRTCI